LIIEVPCYRFSITFSIFSTEVGSVEMKHGGVLITSNLKSDGIKCSDTKTAIGPTSAKKPSYRERYYIVKRVVAVGKPL